MNKVDQISNWIRFFIQVCLIPFCVYLIHQNDLLKDSVTNASIKISLLEQKIDLSASTRDTQLTAIQNLLQDHETRLRSIEHKEQLGKL